MFTGIIEEVGKVVKIEQRGENRRITIEAAKTPEAIENRPERRRKRRLPDGA